jgi:hypothetical protein
MQLLKEIYLTSFVLFFRAFKTAWTPGINAWKGVAGVAVAQWLVLVGLDVWIGMISGKRLFGAVDPWAVRLAVVALFVANHFVLVARGKGIEYEREFDNLHRSKRVLLVTSCSVVILCAIIFFIASAAKQRGLDS